MSSEIKSILNKKESNEEYIPLILGVHHQLTHLPPTISFLETLDIKGKMVMLEIADYPIPSKFKTANSEFCDFFDEIAKIVIENDGIVLAGDSEKLIDEATEKLNKLWVKNPSTYLCERRNIGSEKRELFFLRFARDNKPDIIILDYKHAEFVAQKLGQDFCVIY